MTDSEPTEQAAPRGQVPLLLVTVVVIAACGLVYELLAGTIASYLLGDSVTQFSTIIGTYLSAMGLGAWLSRAFDRALARRFVDVELAVAVVGGFSAPLLFFAFGRFAAFRPLLYGVVIVIGVLVGLEIPLLLRILRDRLSFKEVVAQVLAFDYLGALIASLLFPILLVPRLGLVRSSLAFGALNALAALWTTWLLASEIRAVSWLRVQCLAVLVALMAAFVSADRLTSLAEEEHYADPIVWSKQTPYQRIVLTKNRDTFALFLDGNLQFSSVDEYRYHEGLVHPAFAAAARGRNVLVLGGGDGLAVREILKHPTVEHVTLVDLDPAMTQVVARLPLVHELNGGSLENPRVRVVNADAMAWLAEAPPDARYDVVIVDFPDPNNFSLGKLYTTRFYRLLAPHVADDGAISVQATSPLFARKSYWCIARTLEKAGFAVRPYHVPVPSFGEWGFVLAKHERFDAPERTLAGLRFLDDELLPTLFVFGPDLAPLEGDVNRLDNQILVQYYDEEWRRWE